MLFRSRRKFSKSRFEKMVLDCVVEVAKLHYEMHLKSWLVDEHAAYRDDADPLLFELPEVTV